MAAQIILFTNDLRVHDHPGLHAGVRAGGPVVGLYAFDPLWDGEATTGESGNGVALGFRRMGPHRARFLRECVTDLRASLAALGVPLVVRRAPTEVAAAELLTTLPEAGVHMMAEHGTEEKDVRARVREVADGRLTLHETRNLVHPDDLPFEIAETPELFANFRRKLEKAWTVRDEIPTVPKQDRPDLAIAEGDLPSVEELTGEPEPDGPARFTGGEGAALARLQTYFWDRDRLGVYRETRNGMLSDDDASRFAPYLARGCLSPRRVHAEVRRYERERVENDSTYWLLFELLWRDFYGVILMKHGRQFFHSDGILRIGLPTLGRMDTHLFRAWAEGRTGVTLVDAAQREMLATGFQSNRARQNVASLFIKNLRLDWRLGSAWFERNLLCYDPASNTGNWLYTAGIGNDGRMWRIYNPSLQHERYDPEGVFAQHWLPELKGLAGKAIREPSEDERTKRGYPMPVVDYVTTGAKSKEEYRRAAGFTDREPGEIPKGVGRKGAKSRERGARPRA